MVAVTPAPLDLTRPMRWKGGTRAPFKLLWHDDIAAYVEDQRGHRHSVDMVSLMDGAENIPPEPPPVVGPEKVWVDGSPHMPTECANAMHRRVAASEVQGWTAFVEVAPLVEAVKALPKNTFIVPAVALADVVKLIEGEK